MYILNMNFIFDIVSVDVELQHNPSLTVSHTHTFWIIYIRWRLVHMSYIHAEIDRYNCMHMQSCSFSLIWRHSRVKDFFQSKTKSSDKGNVFILRHENNLQIIWIKSEGTAWTSGSWLPASFPFVHNYFFSLYTDEKIISGELNLCQRGSGK